MLAIAALDDFVAEIVRQAHWTTLRAAHCGAMSLRSGRAAHAADLSVPSFFFDWATGEGTRLVEQLVRQRLGRGAGPASAPGLVSALRCAVRYWVAPWVVARFAELRPLFPELWVRHHGNELSVLVREGRWRCVSGSECAWKLCERRAD